MTNPTDDFYEKPTFKGIFEPLKRKLTQPTDARKVEEILDTLCWNQEWSDKEHDIAKATQAIQALITEAVIAELERIEDKFSGLEWPSSQRAKYVAERIAILRGDHDG